MDKAYDIDIPLFSIGLGRNWYYIDKSIGSNLLNLQRLIEYLIDIFL